MTSRPANRTLPAITPEHLRRLAVIYLRQSTPEQVQKNTGSAEFQRGLREVAQSYGWPDSQIQIIDEDLGKSGSSSEGRTGWQSLQAMIEAKQVGAVFVSTVSRLSRQVLEFELFRLRAALHNVLLYMDDRFLNPADSNDAILSQITAMVAQFENRKRAEIMRQAKLAKAKLGETVSQLPAGWIKTPDGKYDYDPAFKDTIQLVIKTFFETRSIYQTVKVLAKARVQMPRRKNRNIHKTKPNVARVTKILTDPAYSGTYIFGRSRAQAESSIRRGNQSKRIKLPEERWIKIPNHHPPYLSQEEQEEIKTILKNNSRRRRYPVARMRPVTRGLLRCAVCGTRLGVYYPRKNYHFACRTAVTYAEKSCICFSGNDLEECILGEVLKVLEAPPIEMLKSALQTVRTQKQTQLSWIKSERHRLLREERAAQERVEITRGGLPSLEFDALEKLEKVLQKKKQFEQNIVLSSEPQDGGCEEELEELCRIASDVPALWQHKEVTHDDRKEILHCLVDYIAVAATKERIDATIFWKTGGSSSVFVWRICGRHHLIRELHAQKLTAIEIRDHLAAGRTSTGQAINICVDRLYLRMHKMGLKQHRFSVGYLELRQKAAQLYREGQSLKSIARYFNEQSFASATGKAWTEGMVKNLVRATGQKAESMKALHYRLIAEARARGRSYRQIAIEFNKRKIRHWRSVQTWTAHQVERRWAVLKRLEDDRLQKISTEMEYSETVLLKRSA